MRNLRYAFRQLLKAPGFAITAILTLTVGIGATTAIFTLVYVVLLRPLPYPHPERIVVTEEQVAEFRDIYPTLPMNANHFEMWQRNSRTFDRRPSTSEAVLARIVDGGNAWIAAGCGCLALFTALAS